MASRRPLESKIPKLRTSTAPSSPRSPSNNAALSSPSTQSNRKSQSGTSSPRKPISFRMSTTSNSQPLPLTLKTQNPSKEVEGKKVESSQTKTLLGIGIGGRSEENDVLQKKESTKKELQGQGDIKPESKSNILKDVKPEDITFVDAPISDEEVLKALAVTSTHDLMDGKAVPSLSTPTMVDVIYPPNPIRIDSIDAVTTPDLEKANGKVGKTTSASSTSNSPTYLQLYRQQESKRDLMKGQASISDVEVKSQLAPSRQSPTEQFPKPDSLEWDYNSSAPEESRDNFTQTSKLQLEQKTVGVGSFPVFESISKESLLEETRPPSLIIAATTTEPEESENSEVESEDDVGVGVEIEEIEEGSSRLEEAEVEVDAKAEECATKTDTDYYSETEIDYGSMLDDETTDVEDVDVIAPSQGTTGSSGKKAKTIFSVELPVTASKVKSGPGENGDGHYVKNNFPPEESEKEKSVTLTLTSDPYLPAEHQKDQKEMTEIFFRASDHARGRGGSTVPSATTVVERPSFMEMEDENLPKIQVDSRSRIEITPSPIPLSLQERYSYSGSKGKIATAKSSKASQSQVKVKAANGIGDTCKTVEPKTSTLILKRDVMEPTCFSGPIEIMNSTSFLHGFVVLCNQHCLYQISVTPKMGLIAPHSQVSLIVKTNSCKAIQKVDARCRLEVKIFRSFCEELGSLKEYYKKLSEQHPELIKTQPIERILAWNSADLPGMMTLINSIEDEKERMEVMDNLRTENSPKKLGEVDSAALLHSVKTSMLLANHGLREVFTELKDIRNVLHFTIFVGVCMFGFVLIMPYMMTKVETVEVIIPEPEVTWTQSLVQWTNGAWNSLYQAQYDTGMSVANYVGSWKWW